MSDALDTLLSELSSEGNPEKPKDELDTLLSELSGGYTNIPKNASNEPELKEEDISAFILKKASKLITSSIESVDELKDFIVQGQNPDEIAALASLISSASSALESLNKINMLNRKHEMTKELKTLDYKNKKEIAQALPATQNVTNNNVLIASREEIIKKFIESAEQKEKEESVEVDVEKVDLIDEVTTEEISN